MFRQLYPAPTRAGILQRPGAVCDTPFRFGEALLAQRVERRAGGARDTSAMQVWPGTPYPLGATYDGVGTNFSVFSEVAERVELCLFDDDGHRDTRRSAGDDGVLLAWLPPEHAAGTALRIPRPRPVGARRRDSAATPRSCCSIRTPRRSTAAWNWNEAVFPYRFGDPDGSQQRCRRCAVHAEVGGDQSVLRLGKRPPSAHAVARDDHLRDHVKGFTQAPSRHSGASARHVRRPRASRGRSVSADARRHRRRAAARPSVHPRLLAARARAAQLLGLQLDRLSRAAQRVLIARTARRAGAGVQADGEDAARGRHRSDPRRRLQPHRPRAITSGRCCRSRGSTTPRTTA